MGSKNLLQHALIQAHWVTEKLLEDMTEADLFARYAPQANHLAWQLGHLIQAECHYLGVLDSQLGTSFSTSLPEGFAQKHTNETAASNNPADFCDRETYLKLFNQQRQASLAALAAVSESDLEKPLDEPTILFSNVEQVFYLIACHEVMHSGQITAVRRQVGRPVAF